MTPLLSTLQIIVMVIIKVIMGLIICSNTHTNRGCENYSDSPISDAAKNNMALD